MKKLRVWHIPQVPCKAFHVEVSSPEEAIKVLDILANYDLFQYENVIKQDYCSAQGLDEWDEEEKEWTDWYNEDGMDIKDYRDFLNENIGFDFISEIAYNGANHYFLYPIHEGFPRLHGRGITYDSKFNVYNVTIRAYDKIKAQYKIKRKR